MSNRTSATFNALELRIPDTSERIVEGVVVPWNETSYLTPDPKGERFQRGSLDRTIASRTTPVLLFRNHNHDRAVGKSVDWNVGHELGAWAQFRIANRSDGDELLAEVREGLLDAFSIGFTPIQARRGGDGAREVLEARLHEVSIAPIGAYDGARVLAVRTPANAVKFDLPPMPEVDLAPLPPFVRV